VTACGGEDVRRAPQQRAAAPASVARPILLVSGRDDHGMRARARVRLLGAPRFGAPVRAAVPDGALVRVLVARGEWVRVRALERRRAAGWVHDFDLRGTAHLIDLVTCGARLSAQPGAPAARRVQRNAQVEMLEAARRAGATWVRVRTVVDHAGGWVRARAIHELPDRQRCRP